MANISEDKVEDKLQNIDDHKKDDILSSFQVFKDYLGEKVSKGEKLGLNEEQLAKTAEKIADYLAKHEEQRNGEKNASGALETGDKDEQHKLAHFLVKLVG
ncbi:DUF3243 family protein [Peribacillus sp. B-H-3]|uniref:DUF3243 family protein n=1 Tax=Peribacillus sp. B-H-3 TaxID=3400420 RepID=UPI003B019E07